MPLRIADQVLVAGGLEDVVVLDVTGVVVEVREALRLCLLVRVAEQVELELGSAHDRVAGRVCPLELAAQDLAGGDLDGVTGAGIDQIAEHEGGLLQPWDSTQRREVGSAEDVAVALIPVRVLVAGQRGHVDVDREQVVADLDPFGEDLVEEVVAGHSFAHQAAL